MIDNGPRRVRITSATALRAAVTALAVVAVLTALGRSRHVIEWLITAAAVAVLLNGPVHSLASRVHRGIAVAATTVIALAFLAVLGYGVAIAALEQYRVVRTAAPEAAADLERSARFGEVAQRLRLAERTRDAVDAVPTALFGTPTTAAQTAAQRLAEFLLVATIAVFMLAGYDRLVRRLLRFTIPAPDRWRPSPAVAAGALHGAQTARHAVGRAAFLGVVTTVVAGLAGVPAPVVLGLWVAWWRLLPVLGFGVGYLPLVLLLVSDHPAWVTSLALLALAAVELATLRLDRTVFHSAYEGPPRAFVSAVAFSAGFELAGVVGVVVAVVVAHVAVGVLRSLAGPVSAVPPPGVPAPEAPAPEAPAPDARPAATSDRDGGDSSPQP